MPHCPFYAHLIIYYLTRANIYTKQTQDDLVDSIHVNNGETCVNK